MLKYIGFSWFLLVVAVAKSTDKIGCPDDGKIFSLNSTTHIQINCQPNQNTKSLNVTIEGQEIPNDGLSLQILSLKASASNSFKVSKVEENSTAKVIFEGAPSTENGAIWLPTGSSRIRITFEMIQKNSISLRVWPSCGSNFDKLFFPSPILPTMPISATVTCSFNMTGSARIEFTKFNLTTGSEANFIPSSSNGLSGPFTGGGPDHLVILGRNSVLNLKLNLSDSSQVTEFQRTPLTGEACAEPLMLSVTEQNRIVVSGVNSETPTLCTWLIEAPEGKRLSLSFKNISLHGSENMISVIDSGNERGNALLQITALHQETTPVSSSGRYLIVLLNAMVFNKADRFTFLVDPITGGGRFSDNGTITLKNDGNYTLMTSDQKTLVVGFSALTKLNKTQTIDVFVDSATLPLITFNSESIPFDISSPGSELLVVAKGFDGTDVKLDFSSVPKNSGCSRTFVAPQVDNVHLIGSCKGQCSWLVKPLVPASQNLIFLKIYPNNVPTANITHFKGADGKIYLHNSADPFVITYKTIDGIFVEFDCSNAKNFGMSYVTKSDNQDLTVNAGTRANFTLTSPLFPGLYPQGSEFKYNITVSDEKISYLASFHLFDLLPKHTLTLGRKEKVLEFMGSNPPGDILIPASSLADTVLNTSPLISSINPKGSNGFRISFTPTSSSLTMTEKAKSFMTGNKCGELRCVYIIDLPLPANKNESVAVNITITLPQNSSLKASDLLVWDGDSVLRSPLIAPIANLTRGGLFPSKTHKLIVVYNGVLNISLSYVQSPCSFESNTMCLRERLCMPLSWRCNANLDCSDGSDELECQNGLPPKPTPNPPPPPPSSSGWKIAFWVSMPLFILLGAALTKGVPIVLQKLGDSRYQQFHDLGDH